MKRILVCALLACLAAASFAQKIEAGSVGLFGSINNSTYTIGASFQVTDTFALRPSVGLDFISNPDEHPTYKMTTLNLFLFADGLFQLPLAEGLIVGAGPRVTYFLESYGYDFGTYKDKQSYGTFGVGVIGNVQYLFAKNFGAFIDVSLVAQFLGYKYSYGSTSTSSTYATTEIHTSTGLGLVFYLK
jgi:hypothetical protein